MIVLLFLVLMSPAPVARGTGVWPAFTYECEGNACSQVTLVWEDNNQQFKVQNNSDNAVKIEVSTFAGDSTIHVEPHKTAYLLVKSFKGPYRANFE
jgi:hypothetical protein